MRRFPFELIRIVIDRLRRRCSHYAVQIFVRGGRVVTFIRNSGFSSLFHRALLFVCMFVLSCASVLAKPSTSLAMDPDPLIDTRYLDGIDTIAVYGQSGPGTAPLFN